MDLGAEVLSKISLNFYFSLREGKEKIFLKSSYWLNNYVEVLPAYATRG